MTTKKAILTFGYDLLTQATRLALATIDPNPRSPAFAIQEIYKLAQKSGLLDVHWQLHKCIKEEIDALIRDCVSWNESQCHWQTGPGKHVSFEKISQIAVRWYINDWDYKRHARDPEVKYPEDSQLVPMSDEFKHMSNVLTPARYELTRRIFKTKDSDVYHYIDVEKNDDGLFLAYVGHFDDDDLSSHRRCGLPQDFWDLELKTVFPTLKDAQVLSYTVHSLSSKRGV